MKITILSLLIIFLSITGISESVVEQFSIYLPREKIPKKKIYELDVDITKVKLEKYPIIKDDDIISYQLHNHAMELTREAWERLMSIRYGTVFIVCVGKTPIYWGVIWSGILSAPNLGIVIKKSWKIKLEPNWKPDDYSIKIQCGYPTEEYFQGKDLRSDKRIIDALRKSGKLKE